MIRLSNGYCFDFLAESGALASDGRGWPWEWPLRWLGKLDPRLFTIVIKTLTLEPRRGNFRKIRPFDTVKFITLTGEEIHPLKALIDSSSIDGVVNSIGLTNPGFYSWLGKDYPIIERYGYKVIVSITGPNGGEGCAEMARVLAWKQVGNVVAIEFNASCPNTAPTLLNDPDLVVHGCHIIKRAAPNLPLLLKLSYAQPYAEIAKRLEGVVEAIDINTIPWKMVFVDIPSPLAKYNGGGVSGPVTKPKIRIMTEDLARASKIPVIGVGVWEFEDIKCLYDFGAKAVGFGTIFIRWPWKPTNYVRKWRKENGGING